LHRKAAEETNREGHSGLAESRIVGGETIKPQGVAIRKGGIAVDVERARGLFRGHDFFRGESLNTQNRLYIFLQGISLEVDVLRLTATATALSRLGQGSENRFP